MRKFAPMSHLLSIKSTRDALLPSRHTIKFQFKPQRLMKFYDHAHLNHCCKYCWLHSLWESNYYWLSWRSWPHRFVVVSKTFLPFKLAPTTNFSSNYMLKGKSIWKTFFTNERKKSWRRWKDMITPQRLFMLNLTAFLLHKALLKKSSCCVFFIYRHEYVFYLLSSLWYVNIDIEFLPRAQEKSDCE